MELEIFRGRTNKINVYVSENGAAYDLTGCSLYMTAKSEVTDADAAAIFQLGTAGGTIVVTSAINGQAQVVISPTHTATLPYAKKILYFDLMLKTSQGEYWTIASGTFAVKPNITRAT